MFGNFSKLATSNIAPQAKILEISAKTGEGMEACFELIQQRT